MKDSREAPGKLKFGTEKKAGTDPEENETMGEDTGSLHKSQRIGEKGRDRESDEEGDEERLELEGKEDAQSEGVSLPPSSRPSTPPSLDDNESEHFEALGDEMEEDK